MSKNYDFSYSEMTGLNESTPIHVEVDTNSNPVPVVRGMAAVDYIPSPERRRKMPLKREIGIRTKAERSSNANLPNGQIIKGPPDYVSGEETQERNKSRNATIIKKAKEIQKERKDQWSDYKEAKELILDLQGQENFTEMVTNDPKVRRANAIYQAGKPAPFSKEACIEAARNSVLGLSS